jgi:hypothetical protein
VERTLYVVNPCSVSREPWKSTQEAVAVLGSV